MKKTVRTGMSSLMILCLLGCGSSSSSTEEMPKQEEPVEETAQQEETVPEKEESPWYFKDLEIVTKDYTIRITDWKVIQPGEEGNSYGDEPVIAFWYSTTNNAEKEISPMMAWLKTITAVQDNDPNMINTLNSASHPDSKLLDNQLAAIKQGGTVDNAMAYTLTDTVTPVELTATDGILGDELGGMTFNIVTHEASNGTAAAISSETSTPVREPSFNDNTIITKDYTIEITDWKIIQPGEEGNRYSDEPVIAFWYSTTNNSGKEISPMMAWIKIIDAVQDNDPNKINKLDMAALPDDRFLDSQIADIKQGGTVENAVAYTLTDLETPVTLTVLDGPFGKELGKQQFDLR